ncbi:5' nucleotidase, NT5C type [Leuconostoc carnosum]|uniref:5' nucleotidase, NT5C type n=1 Tax=Leuconostoc carnosum TaxID=1252 RepID=UPI00345D3674
MVMKPKLFLDMDNVLVDTLSILNVIDMRSEKVKKPDQIPGVFRDLPPMIGAIEAVKSLSENYELHILSTAPWQNASAWQDKLLWLAQYFGDDKQSPFYKRVTLTHDKSLAHGVGGILIDDRPYHGASQWNDEMTDSLWIQYGYDAHLVWSAQLVNYLNAVAKAYKVSGTLRLSAEAVAKQAGYQLFGQNDNFEKAHWE